MGLPKELAAVSSNLRLLSLEKHALLPPEVRDILGDVPEPVRIALGGTPKPSAIPAGIGLTPRLADTLSFIREYIDREGHSPSYREIAIGTGMSCKSVGRAYEAVTSLIERGYVRRLPGGSLVVGEGRG